MTNIIIVKEESVAKIMNIKGYIEMRLRPIDKLGCQLVDDAHTCVAFQIRTSKKRFETIAEELYGLFPGVCCCLTKKEA